MAPTQMVHSERAAVRDDDVTEAQTAVRGGHCGSGQPLGTALWVPVTTALALTRIAHSATVVTAHNTSDGLALQCASTRQMSQYARERTRRTVVLIRDLRRYYRRVGTRFYGSHAS
jgi:hypothetical protein